MWVVTRLQNHLTSDLSHFALWPPYNYAHRIASLAAFVRLTQWCQAQVLSQDV